jgi:hypothetical protein
MVKDWLLRILFIKSGDDKSRKFTEDVGAWNLTPRNSFRRTNNWEEPFTPSSTLKVDAVGSSETAMLSHKTVLFIVTSVRTSDLTMNFLIS